MHPVIGGVTPGTHYAHWDTLSPLWDTLSSSGIPYPPLEYTTLLVTSGGNHWIPAETCSSEDLPLPPHPLPGATSSGSDVRFPGRWYAFC